MALHLPTATENMQSAVMNDPEFRPTAKPSW